MSSVSRKRVLLSDQSTPEGGCHIHHGNRNQQERNHEHGNNGCFKSSDDGNAPHQKPEGERAAISHKNLGRIKIVNQKSQRASQKRRSDDARQLQLLIVKKAETFFLDQ